MTQNGQNLSTVDEQLEIVNKSIESYKHGLQLHALAADNKAHEYLSMPYDKIKNLSADECGEAALLISRLANYLQLEINKLNSILTWCNDKISWIIAKTILQYDKKYISYENKRLLAIQNDDVATKIYRVSQKTKLQLTQIEFIPMQLNHVADKFVSLQQNKRRYQQQ